MVTFQKENGIVFDHPARARKMVTFQKEEEDAHFEVDQHIPLPLNSMSHSNIKIFFTVSFLNI